jgi:nucleoside-diphosphate-sugar epimerase
MYPDFFSWKAPIKENAPCEPWTLQAKFKLAVEQELKHGHPDLDYVIVRPAIVYGSGDKAGLGLYMYFIILVPEFSQQQ